MGHRRSQAILETLGIVGILLIRAPVLPVEFRLSLEGTNSINPETWVKGNISYGGQYLAEGAELKLYGTEGARRLEIVGTAPPASRSGNQR